MLTPWVKPVTAGKKIANRIQKSAPPAGAAQLASNTVLSQRLSPPQKNESSAAPSIAMTTYWNRVAQSAPSQAKTKRKMTAAAAVTWGFMKGQTGASAARASPKPMQ